MNSLTLKIYDLMCHTYILNEMSYKLNSKPTANYKFKMAAVFSIIYIFQEGSSTGFVLYLPKNPFGSATSPSKSELRNLTWETKGSAKKFEIKSIYHFYQI